MLLDISKPYLELVRGDTFRMPLYLNAGTRECFEPYTISNDDVIYIGITKPGQPFEVATVRCKLDIHSEFDASGNLLFVLSHDETKNLEPGKYYITIKFVSDSIVTTLVDQKLLYVTGTPTCCGGCY
jgi:hypothetical protein